jgi:hypothetical protein
MFRLKMASKSRNMSLSSLNRKLIRLCYTTFYFSVSYLLTHCSRFLLEKLTSLQLVKKLPAFYGSRWFITTFTSAHHLSLT